MKLVSIDNVPIVLLVGDQAAEEREARERWFLTAERSRAGVCGVCGRDRDDDGKPLLVARAKGARLFKCFTCTTKPTRRRRSVTTTTRTKAAAAKPAVTPAAQRFEMLPLAKLKPAPDNPRKDVGDVTEMAETMKTLGVLEPFVTVQQNGHYLIVAGHRRYAAAQLAGLVEVPAIVRELTEEQRVQAMLIENLQREDLSALEEARAFRRLVDEFKVPQRELAARIGRSQGHISKRLQLLQLPPKVLAQVDSGGITIGDALELVKLVDHPTLIGETLKKAREWHRSIQRAVEDALAEVAKHEQREREVQAIKDAGIRYVKIGEYGEMPRGSVRVDPDRAYDSLPMRVATHAKLACHAAGVYRGQRIYVCTDPGQHPELDKANQVVKTDAKQARARQHEKDLNAARGERRTFLNELASSSSRLTKDEALAIIIDGFFDRAEAEARKVACQTLGLDPIETKSKYTRKLEKSWYGVLEAYAEKSFANATRAAVVLAWAGREIRLNSAWSSWGNETKAYFKFLEAQGYSPTAAEKLELTGKSPRR